MFRKNFAPADLTLVEPARDHFRGREPGIGDAVRLISGGPAMVVNDKMGDALVCAWDDGRKGGTFPRATLRPAD